MLAGPGGARRRGLRHRAPAPLRRAGRYELRSWALATRLRGDAAAIARVAEAPEPPLPAPRRAAGSPRRPTATSLEGIAAETRVSKIAGAFLWDLVGRASPPASTSTSSASSATRTGCCSPATWKYERFRPGRRDPRLVGRLEQPRAGLDLVRRAADPRRRRLLSFDTRDYWTAKLAVKREMSALSTDLAARRPRAPACRRAPRYALSRRHRSAQGVLPHARRRGAARSRRAARAPERRRRSSTSASPTTFQWSIGTTYERDVVGWQPSARRARGLATVVARLRQETLALTLRGDLTFTPRLALQAYLQPFSSTGRYDRHQRLAAPRDPDPARRFVPVAPDASRTRAPDAQQPHPERRPRPALGVLPRLVPDRGLESPANVIALDPGLSAASGLDPPARRPADQRPAGQGQPAVRGEA